MSTHVHTICINDNKPIWETKTIINPGFVLHMASRGVPNVKAVDEFDLGQA